MGTKVGMYGRHFKRPLDTVVSATVIILLLPLYMIITLILLVKNKGYPFFIQNRPGRAGRIFRVIKFRTMNDARDREGNYLPDGERLTTVGRVIRRLSLDELPQLFNVLTGDMSLIGPRPLLVEYLPLYDAFQNRRHEVRPGITGWAQVNGRNAISWEEKFKFDVWYVDNLSFCLDLKIVWLTLKKVVKREGIDQDKINTMEKFKGNY